jgi:hypothetical protein
MATADRNGKGIKARNISSSAGIRPYQLDIVYASSTAFLAAKKLDGQNSGSAEEGDWYYDSTLNTFQFYNGSAWVDAASGIALARGNIIRGNSSGIGAAYDANDNGKILVGDGTDLVSVAVSGDVTLASSGATTVTDLTIASEARGDLLRRGSSGWERVSAKDSGKFVIGDGTDVISATMSGDATVSAAGAVTIAAGAVTSAKLDEQTIRYAAVSLTNAEVLALRATPITLVAAPGAGKVLEFVSACLLFDYTAAYTQSNATDDLAVRYNNAGTLTTVSETIEATNFLTGVTADTINFAIPKVDPIVTKANAEDKPLALHNIGAAELGGGDASNALRVKVAYRVHTTGF